MVSGRAASSKQALTLDDLPEHILEVILTRATEPLITTPCQEYDWAVREQITIKLVSKRYA